MTRLYNCSETPTGVFLLFFYRDAKMRLPFIRTQWSIPAQTARSTAKETVIYSSAVNGRFRYPAARTPLRQSSVLLQPSHWSTSDLAASDLPSILTAPQTAHTKGARAPARFPASELPGEHRPHKCCKRLPALR